MREDLVQQKHHRPRTTRTERKSPRAAVFRERDEVYVIEPCLQAQTRIKIAHDLAGFESPSQQTLNWKQD